MDFEDHFTSYQYHNLYWMNFESFVEQCCPSPEGHQSYKTTTGDNSEATHNNCDRTETASEQSDEELPQNIIEGNLNDEDVYIEQLQNDEIRIDSNNFGNIIPKATQVMDYLY